MAKSLYLLGLVLMGFGLFQLGPAIRLLTVTGDPMAVINAPIVMNSIGLVVYGIVLLCAGKTLSTIGELKRSAQEMARRPDDLGQEIARNRNATVSTLNSIHGSVLAESRKIHASILSLRGGTAPTAEAPVQDHRAGTRTAPQGAREIPGSDTSEGVAPYWSSASASMRYEGAAGRLREQTDRRESPSDASDDKKAEHER
jgi:hypothetical protein